MCNGNLRQLRGKRTLLEVSMEIGIPITTYASIESGYRKGRPENMHKIASFYGYSIDKLFFSQEKIEESICEG